MNALACFLDDTRMAFLPRGSIRRRFNKDLQRIEYRVPTYVKVGNTEGLPGVKGIYAWYVKNDLTPFLKGALLRVKMRWTTLDPYADSLVEDTSPGE